MRRFDFEFYLGHAKTVSEEWRTEDKYKSNSKDLFDAQGV
jgi:hypothetical protein